MMYANALESSSDAILERENAAFIEMFKALKVTRAM
jgi:hypothetical protein